jgi:ATP-dependent helicase HrpA
VGCGKEGARLNENDRDPAAASGAVASVTTRPSPTPDPLAGAMLRDRRRLGDWQRRLQSRRVGEDAGEHRRFERELQASIARAEERRRSLPVLSYDGSLPIHAQRARIAAAIAAHPIVIVSGATGSGKSTQLPKICLEIGRGIHGLIGHTQPRRIAAQSLAQRIATELKTSTGHLVGYQVRFVDRTGPQTLVKLMTDGVLLRELENDRRLERYDTLIIDEAHERSLNIDFLLGVCRTLCAQRPELRVLVTSATIETERLSAFFDGAPVIDVEGRSYPVEVRYRPADEEDESRTSAETLRAGVEEALAESATAGGDVLVFLPGERQIHEARDVLARVTALDAEVLPLYSRLGFQEQERVFAPHAHRRVILATNVAETSLTIPGVRAVVDTGLARTSRYSPRAKIQRLPIEPVSRANAEQRKGRCGREAPGLCIRLYSEQDFLSRPEHPEPEIRRTNLASLILQMAALGLGSPAEFPFVDPPDHRLLNDGYRLLQDLRAIDDDRRITRLGRQMAALPLDPRLSRALIEAARLGCLREMIVVAAFLSLQDPRERPPDRTALADEAHAGFADPRSDFQTVLNLWGAYASLMGATSSALRRWCREHFVSHRRMREWQDLKEQLTELASRLQLRVNAHDCAPAALHQALLSGFLGGIGVRDEARTYLGARDARFWIAPGTPLAKRLPHWLVAASLVETDRLYARMVAQVQPSWIEAAGAHLVKREYSAAEWSAERGMVLATETVSLYGRVLSSGRRIDFAAIDAAVAHRIFASEALVHGQATIDAAFLERNAALRVSIERVEAKLRRRDLVADDDTLTSFYATRIPEQIASVRSFARWWRGLGRDHEGMLDWPIEVAATGPLPACPPELYPDWLDVGGNRLPLEYRFDPTSADDGVTVRLPLALLDAASSARFEWLIPGYLRDKVLGLLRGVPKEIRRTLLPIPETADRFVASVTFGEGSLYARLAEFVTQESGLAVGPEALASVPRSPWLDFRIVVVSNDGSTWGEARDLVRLRADPRRLARPAAARVTAWQREDIRRWDFGDWPDEVSVATAGMVVRMRAGLEDTGHAVRQRLYASESEALHASRRGIVRLAANELAQVHGALRAQLARDREFALLVAAAGFGRGLLDELADRAVGEAVVDDDHPLPRSPAAFEAALESGRANVHELGYEIRETVIATLTQIRAARGAAATLAGRGAEEIRESVDSHLDRLFAPGWLRETPAPWFERLPKYAQAAARRVALAATNRARHDELEAQVATYDREFRELELRAPATTHGLARAALRWMIEEFRVSLYAQELRTVRPVSAKRLAALVSAAKREADGA